MWLMTKHGFYSVVLARRDPANPSEGADPDTVMIRARVRVHLVNLSELNPAVSGFEILESKDTDYRYRIICPREVWAVIHTALLADLDYQNFKGACEEKYGWKDRYCMSLHDAWSVMNNLQR